MGIGHKKTDILNKINQNKLVGRFAVFLFGIFGLGMCYNLFFVPNKLVVGGVSGLSIVAHEITGIPNNLFIYLMSAVLIVLSFIVLGRKQSVYTIIGSVSYSVMVTITEPIAAKIPVTFSSDFLMILTIILIYGFCGGLVYRAGFNTGGSDVIAAIISKLAKIELGKSSTIVNMIIILSGMLLFGLKKTIYAMFILITYNKLVDMVLLGINDSKLVFIKSKQSDRIEKYVTRDLGLGATEIASKGGLFTKKEATLLMIVPFNLYYGLKHTVLDIDPNAFISAHNCYTVKGGHNKKIIPF